MLLAGGTPVSEERLVDALWGEELPVSARNSLQSHVSRLRAALDIGRQMRAAQRGYFKHRTQMALTDSKRLEQALDRLLASGPGLFDA